jgi:carboxyl-terminal processing protease
VTVTLAVGLLAAGLAGGAARAAEAPREAAPARDRLDDLRRQALACERRGDWLEACRWYDEILRKDRGQAEARDSFQRCLRRYHMTRRHRDNSYRQLVTRLTPAQALDVYEQVLATVAAAYVDRSKTHLSHLFAQGVQELRLALEETVFVQEHFADAAPESVAAFRDRLDGWRDFKVASRREARDQVLAVVKAGYQAGLVPRPGVLTVVALEFACGACNALDEYTLFLTPAAQGEVQAGQRGKAAGVGIALALVDQHLEVARVYPRSPAREMGILRHDRVLRIDGQPVDGLPAEVAAERLRGGDGKAVELEVLSPGQMEPRVVKLTRRPVVVPTVDHDLQTVMAESEPVPIGFVRISHFQDSTVQEVKEALASLQTVGMRVLILDLRGNPGGSFESAVQVSKLFLSEGVIVITQTHFPRLKGPFQADAGTPVAVPMVVLIDGDTASAAEVVAGALKENRRATLVGQTTFGKGSIQCVIPLDKPPLDKRPGGIRITVARFYSPARHPYNGVGVSPDVPFAAEGDPVVAEARRLLLGMLKPMPPMIPAGLPR